MKRMTLTICLTALCLAPLGTAVAQDENDGNKGRVFLVDVKQGHGDEFRAGLKAYFECYGEHDGEKCWNVYAAQSGRPLCDHVRRAQVGGL